MKRTFQKEVNAGEGETLLPVRFRTALRLLQVTGSLKVGNIEGLKNN